MPEPITSPNKLLSISGLIIVTLVGLVWSFTNNRLNSLEEWRKDQESHAELLLTKQRIYQLSKQIDKLEAEIKALREELARRPMHR